MEKYGLRKILVRKFDFIFADTWPGKYNHLDETISMLNPGGIYIIDDMIPQPNWPEGHDLKATALIENLCAREDIMITKQVWATVKRNPYQTILKVTKEAPQIESNFVMLYLSDI